MRNVVRPVRRKGRGIFASRDYRAGEVIEQAPVIVANADDWPHLRRTVLRDYVFEWGAHRVGIALGHGSLYNHSERPNADCEALRREKLLVFTARRPIRKGQEITIDYRGEEHGRELWFRPHR